MSRAARAPVDPGRRALAALGALVKALDAAARTAPHAWLGDLARERPDHVREGLAAVVLRVVFLRLAEAHGLVAASPSYDRARSLSALHRDLGDHDRTPARAAELVARRARERGAVPPPARGRDAWARLLDLTRSVHAGDPEHGVIAHGSRLFDPRSWPFLAGRREGLDAHTPPETSASPASLWVDDATVRSLLDTLCPATMDRDSLTPESLGTAHEAMLGWSIASREGATGVALVPSSERRRAGSHYTPRALADEVTRDTLRPVLEALGADARPENLLTLRVCDPATGTGAFLLAASRQLGAQLAHAFDRHGWPAHAPQDDEARRAFARREIARCCLYGVDLDAMAVEATSLALWLETRAAGEPFDTFDHAVRRGDALVGLSFEQLAALHWAPTAPIAELEPLARDAIAAAARARASVREPGVALAPRERREALRRADEALACLRPLADALVAAFVGERSTKARAARRDQLVRAALAALAPPNDAPRDDAIARLAASLAAGERPLRCLHWALDFAEVFAPPSPCTKAPQAAGFDVVLGNPPFAQKNAVARAGRPGYVAWLTLAPGASARADLAAFFVRRAFDLLAPHGSMGLLATNTIAQGDTRAAGLAWVTAHGGVIHAARCRIAWPGRASVVVSRVHVLREATTDRICHLDDRPARRISAYLVEGDLDGDPSPLAANAGLAFHGVDPSGRGFFFDDRLPGAHPVATLRRVLDEEPAAAACVARFVGGEDLNGPPAPARYVIGFGRRSLDACRRDFPRLLALVEATVAPDRARRPDNPQARHLAARWWQWHTERPRLKAALAGQRMAIVGCHVAPHLIFARHPTDVVFAHTLHVVALATPQALGVLQSRVHEAWARLLGSTLRDDLRYTVTGCFDTFPFPHGYEANDDIGRVAEAIERARAALSLAHGEGLTATYNRVHDPREVSPLVLDLRRLHDALDAAVLEAYGWSDLAQTCVVRAEHPGGDRSPRRGRVRFGWPDALRDAVLERLLALNAARARDDQLAGRATRRRRAAPPSST